MSTFLMLLALQYGKTDLDPRTQNGKASLKTMAILTLPPIMAVILTVIQVAYARGGLAEGIHRLADILVARTGDWRISDSQWYPNRTFIKNGEMSNYPNVVATRIKSAMGFDARLFIGMLIAAVALAGKTAWSRYRWLPIAVIAGLSWNLVMVQHTFVHKFAGMYGYFLWMLIVAVFYREFFRTSIKIAGNVVARTVLVASLLWFLYEGINNAYYPRVVTYYKNITKPDNSPLSRRLASP